MRVMTMYYPGDPPQLVQEMSRAEFLAIHPRTPLLIVGGGKVQLSAIPADLIVCDCCSAEITGDAVFVVCESRGYCHQCATQYVIPHIRPPYLPK